MTGVEIALVISNRLTKLMSVQNMMHPGDMNNKNIKSVLNQALNYILTDLKRECGLLDLTIDLNKMSLQCSTPNKGFTFKVTIDDRFRLFYPNKQKEYYES